MKVYELGEAELAEIEEAAFSDGVTAAANLLTAWLAEAHKRGDRDVAVLTAVLTAVRGLVSVVAGLKVAP